MEKCELHRPDCARGGVAAHERTTQQHVLRANDDCWSLRVIKPACRFDTTHEHIDLVGGWKQTALVNSGLLQIAQPALDCPGGLLNQCAHRQAPDKPSRRTRCTHSVCRPADGDPCCLSRASWCNQNLRPLIHCQPALPTERRRFPPERNSI